MTPAERQGLLDAWRGHYCVHPQFADVETGPGTTARACTQCGEFIDDIVLHASHIDLLVGISRIGESEPDSRTGRP